MTWLTVNNRDSYLHVACSAVARGVVVTTAVPSQWRGQQVGVVRRRGLGTAGRLCIRRVLRWALWTEESGHGGGAARGRARVHTLWPPGPPRLVREVLQCPMSSMQLPGGLFSCLGLDRGQLEDRDIGSCFTVTPKKCCPIMVGVCWWCMEGWGGGGTPSCVAP